MSALLPRVIACQTCEATGWEMPRHDDPADLRPCETCDGNKYLHGTYTDALPGPNPGCQSCLGTGSIDPAGVADPTDYINCPECEEQ